MYANYIYTDINEALPKLCNSVMNEGFEVGSRLGDRTMELTHVGVTLTQPVNRYITLTSRKANVAAQIAETMWVLAGRNDIEFLSHYLPRAEEFSDDGETWRAGYGPRLRAWHNTTDQLANVVKLLQASSLTRRATMSIFDPASDFNPDTKDIPCNNWLSFSNRNGRLDLHVAIRSNDLIWGLSGINAFEWSALLEIVAGLVGVSPGSLHLSITSLHVYDRHWARASKIALDHEPPRPALKSPRFHMADGARVEHLDELVRRWFAIEALIRGNGDGLVEYQEVADLLAVFPEPMMRSWLNVLGFYWSGDARYLTATGVAGTPLAAAANLLKPKRAGSAQAAVPAPVNEFDRYVSKLHADKNAAYGDSWKRRGESLGIMANVARKIDRLGKTDDHETAADTAIDLLVYLLKYRMWLVENVDGTPLPYSDPALGQYNDVDAVTYLLDKLPKETNTQSHPDRLSHYLRERFEQLWNEVQGQHSGRYRTVSDMIVDANRLARHLYWQQGNATRQWNPEQEATA